MDKARLNIKALMNGGNRLEARHVRDLLLINILIILFVGMESYDLLFFALLGISTIVGLIVFPNRSLMIVPFLFLSIPLEISKSWIPVLVTTYSREGNVSVLDFSRLGIAIVFILWVITEIRNRKFDISTNALTLSLLLFLLYSIYSTVVVAGLSSRGMIESVRYLSYFILLLLTIRYITNVEDLRRTFQVLIVLGVILSVIGLFEFATRIHLWMPVFGVRTNTTFGDPNMFGRFLAILLCVLLYRRLNRNDIHIIRYDIMIFLAALALLLTISRAGVLALGVALGFLFLASDLRIKKALFVMGIFAGAITTISLSVLVDLRGGGLEVSDIGQRSGLILTGLTMFWEHPIWGVGLGGFQEFATTLYEHLLPWGGRGVTLSHTAVITIMAEMGIVGFLLLSNIMFQFYRNYKQMAKSQNSEITDYSKMIMMMVIIIFVSAQSAGRLFEDPMLWLLIGAQVSLTQFYRSEERKQSVITP